jgi:hypothetical protein
LSGKGTRLSLRFTLAPSEEGEEFKRKTEPPKRQSGNKKFNKIVLMKVDSKPLSRLFIDDQQLIV